MKKFAWILVAAAFLLTAAPALAGPAIVGEPAPGFAVKDSNGKTVKLSQFKGKYVVLEWTNYECPFVERQYNTGNMQKIKKQMKSDGVIWLTVASSAPGKQGFVDGAHANKLTVDRKAFPHAVILDHDGKLGRLYGAKTTPHMFLIGKDGKLAYAGAIDDAPDAEYGNAKNYVVEALANLKAGKPVAPASTLSYGCGIKYAE